ncbi:hypothetical protein Riv7116_6810 [Rivularia sp. PCC 7116]|nr:hypothetical protein Riv7116_6810 [Rivularia sp. PCC 7116]
MLAKSYTKILFGGNIWITPLCQNNNSLYISSKRVLCPFWEMKVKNRALGNIENILKQTFYEMVITL